MVEPESARWLWGRLQANFPRAYAASLMPDHLHLGDGQEGAAGKLDKVLRHHGRRFGLKWDVTHETPSTTRKILTRTVGYIWLNPVRGGLVEDPFAWPWSTLRDAVGAVADPWVRGRRLTIKLRRSVDRLVRDVLERAAQEGNRVGPPPAFPDHASYAPDLDTVARAAASALRTHPTDIRRRGPTRTLFVQLAYRVGHPRADRLAEHCHATTRTTRNLRARSPHPGLPAATRCLADPRLHRHDV